MLTKRQNLMETIRGGCPDRFVNQYEAFQMVFDPVMMQGPMLKPGGDPVVNAWGVTMSWPAGTPGAFPVHTPDRIVIKDITHWEEYVHAPETKLPDAAWEPFVRAAEETDREEQFVTSFVAPGIFEQCHNLGEIQRTLMYFYEEPEAMHGLIRYLTDYELSLAEEICRHIRRMPFSIMMTGEARLPHLFLRPCLRNFCCPPTKKFTGITRATACS
jgi:hypothetical protein